MGGTKDAVCREVTFGVFQFNPVVTLFGMGGLWAFTIWCMAKPDEALDELTTWQAWVTEIFTWFYVGSQDVWAVFAIYLYFSKYGGLKLCARGEEEKKPEFSNATYFMMLFSAGVAVGLFFFGIAEPIWHYRGSNRYTLPDGGSDNLDAQWALTLSVFHWGIHGWIPYMVVAATLGFVHFRQGLPMSMRSCFYPLIGNHIYGWMGDVVDVLSIITVVAGVCTSLGLGVAQIAEGMLRINPDLWDSTDEDTNTNAQIALIWCITLLATASVVSGIHIGIKYLSMLAFVLGMFLWMSVLFLDNTWFFLNLMCQTIGHYLNYILELGWFTDAFSQLTLGSGGAPDELSSPDWMNGWTIFYWGWWIAWSPFVGLFVARISKGRTIREVINYTLTAPLLYAVMWFGVFGGAGIKMQNTAEYLAANGGVEVDGCYDNPADPGNSPACDLYQFGGSTSMWFMVMEQYYGLGTFLSVVSVAAIIVYFITSSDSGSLVVEFMAANGKEDSHPAQRVLWALTEGALACGLIKAGGADGTRALQAASICAGLPYTVILCMLCTALYRAVREEMQEIQSALERRNYKMPLLGGIFDIIETILSLGKSGMPTGSEIVGFFVACAAPGMYFAKANKGLPASQRAGPVFLGAMNVLFYAFLLLQILEVVEEGLFAIGWVLYIGFAVMGTVLRAKVREHHGIIGTVVEDMFATILAYPQVALQAAIQMEEVPVKEDPSTDMYAEEAKHKESAVSGLHAEAETGTSQA